jgi:hypothetical protein
MSLYKIIVASRELLDEKQAAAKLDVTPGTLSVWRSTGRYALPFVKVGRKVRYRLCDLDSWLEKRTRSSGATA